MSTKKTRGTNGATDGATTAKAPTQRKRRPSTPPIDAPTTPKEGSAPQQQGAVEPTPDVAPKRRGRPVAVTNASDAAAPHETTTTAHEHPDAVRAAKRTRSETRSKATLADLAAGYVAHLEASGKSEGTVFSYRLELRTALEELGADSLATDLTPERVLAFFISDRVTKTRTGRSKSVLSIDKTRRVWRQALVWAEGSGMVAKAPMPEDAASH